MENPLDKKFKSLTPACYGCVFACATPALSCEHPLSIRLSYDGFTKRCYRFPSFEMCIMNKGLCNFYEPSKAKGAEYALMREEERELAEKKKIDKLLEETDTMTKEDFLAKLRQIASPLDKDDDIE